jgi:hypothetical protein
VSDEGPLDRDGLLRLAWESNASLAWASRWIEVVKAADTIGEIAAAISQLGSTGSRGAHYDAYRDSARVIIEDRLTERLRSTMERLRAAAIRLCWVGIVLAVPTAIIAAVQLWQLFRGGQ